MGAVAQAALQDGVATIVHHRAPAVGAAGTYIVHIVSHDHRTVARHRQVQRDRVHTAVVGIQVLVVARFGVTGNGLFPLHIYVVQKQIITRIVMDERDIDGLSRIVIQIH